MHKDNITMRQIFRRRAYHAENLVHLKKEELFLILSHPLIVEKMWLYLPRESFLFRRLIDRLKVEIGKIVGKFTPAKKALRESLSRVGFDDTSPQSEKIKMTGVCKNFWRNRKNPKKYSPSRYLINFWVSEKKLLETIKIWPKVNSSRILPGRAWWDPP